MGPARARERGAPYEHSVGRKRGQEKVQQLGGRLQNTGQSEDLAKSACPNNTGSNKTRDTRRKQELIMAQCGFSENTRGSNSE